MQSVRKSTVMAVSFGVLVLGGGIASAVALGANGHGKSHRNAPATLEATTSTTSTSTDPAATVPFKSNEDPAHEAGESAAEEAAEDAGRRPDHGGNGGAFHPREDAAHEAGESAAREAQEDAGQRPTVP